MSNRKLAWTAVWFAGLLGLLAFVGAHRFGYLDPLETPQWEFRNVLLDCRMGTICQLNPGRVDQARQRFWFLRTFAEPAVDDLSAANSPIARYAHVRAGVTEQRPHEEGWFFKAPALIAFRQLGGVGSDEWLTEIGMVREVESDGSARDLLRATFKNAARAQMHYLYDPEETLEEQSRRGMGWVHMIQEARGFTSEVFYMEPAGFQEPPTPK